MNTLDADKYRINVKDVITFTQDKNHKDRMEFMGMLAVATNVPIIIVATFVGELYGFTPDLNSFIDELKLFYSIDKVLNIRVKD